MGVGGFVRISIGITFRYLDKFSGAYLDHEFDGFGGDSAIVGRIGIPIAAK